MLLKENEMVYRINYNKNFEDDSFIIEAETIEEIRTKSFEELNKRGVDLTKNSAWSECISE